MYNEINEITISDEHAAKNIFCWPLIHTVLFLNDLSRHPPGSSYHQWCMEMIQVIGVWKIVYCRQCDLIWSYELLSQNTWVQTTSTLLPDQERSNLTHQAQSLNPPVKAIWENTKPLLPIVEPWQCQVDTTTFQINEISLQKIVRFSCPSKWIITTWMVWVSRREWRRFHGCWLKTFKFFSFLDGNTIMKWFIRSERGLLVKSH